MKIVQSIGFAIKLIILLLVCCIVLEAPVIAGSKKKGLRKYYRTQANYTGSQATTACEKGFHMASLWEIFNTSALQYDVNLGFTLPDSGFGPPVGFGWIRTGGNSNNQVNVAALDNCLAWTVNDGKGTAVSLPGGWGTTPSNVNPWIPGLIGCDDPIPVWCVQD